MVAKIDVLKLCCAPSQGCPSFKEWVGFLIKSVKVVRDPQTVEVLVDGRQNMFTLILNDRLVITPLITNHRRQPTETETLRTIRHGTTFRRLRLCQLRTAVRQP